jgi:2,3-bisphosphoglycerate-independent phosphoglycerate mutase
VRDLTSAPTPIVLAILDGWGLSGSWTGNAILHAQPGTFLELWHTNRHAVLEAVSVADRVVGQVGSSKLGHTSIGTGRLMRADATDLTIALASGTFFTAPAVQHLFTSLHESHAALHLLSVISPSTEHASMDHLYGCLEAARRSQVDRVFIHAILDGVEAPAGESTRLLGELVAACQARGIGQLASVVGRSFVMDHAPDDRVVATALSLLGRGEHQLGSIEAVFRQLEALDDAESVLPPTNLIDQATGHPLGPVQPSDVVLALPTRRESVEPLIRALNDPSAYRRFGLTRRLPLSGATVATLTDYHLNLTSVLPLFASTTVADPLGRILADHSIPQHRIATEDRLPHVTEFLNGGHIDPYDQELRTVLPFPGNRTTVEHEVDGLVRAALSVIHRRSATLTVVHFGAVDRVAHSGDFLTTAAAVRAVDDGLHRLATATLSAGGRLLVTADHGNAEAMLPPRRRSRHTANSVPFIFVDTVPTAPLSRLNWPPPVASASHASLADVTPTILELLQIAKPTSMTGRSLIDRLSPPTHHRHRSKSDAPPPPRPA